MNQEIHLTMDHGSGGDVSPGELVPLVVPVASFGAMIVTVGLVLYFRFRSQRLKQELVTAYLDRGQDVPKSLLGAAPQTTRSADLRRGLVLLATGLSLALAFAVAGQRQAFGVGAVPTFIGLAYLLVWKIEQKQGRDAEHG